MSEARKDSRSHFFTTGLAVGREWSAIKNVARGTGTIAWQRGHLGSIELPAAPSRYESGAWQCGHGPNLACIGLMLRFHG